jgi:hypothetical protein
MLGSHHDQLVTPAHVAAAVGSATIIAELLAHGAEAGGEGLAYRGWSEYGPTDSWDDTLVAVDSVSAGGGKPGGGPQGSLGAGSSGSGSAGSSPRTPRPFADDAVAAIGTMEDGRWDLPNMTGATALEVARRLGHTAAAEALAHAAHSAAMAAAASGGRRAGGGGCSGCSGGCGQ